MKIRITCNAEVGVNATGYTACAHQSPDGGSWEPVLDSTRRPIELAHSSEEGARERVQEALQLAGFKPGEYELVD